MIGWSAGTLARVSRPTITITVTGHASRVYPPNRCSVELRVHFDGATRAAAADPLTASTDVVRDLIAAQNGAVRRWTFGQVRHARRRPFDRDGKQLDWLYESSGTFTVTFRDLAAVGGFVDRAVDVEGAEVTNLRWSLSRKALARAQARVRDHAVRDAREKAAGYAGSRRRLRAVAIADPGMLGLPGNPRPPEPRAMFAAAPAPAGEAVERVTVFEPEPVLVRADVEARFVTD